LKIDFKKRQNAAGCLLKKFEEMLDNYI